MELLVRIIDKPRSGKIELDAQRTTAGDVIVYARDGHIWGAKEVSNPEWRIVKVPGMSEAEAKSLASHELARAFGGNRLLQKRQFRLDVDALGLTGERTATRKGHDVIVSLGDIRQHRTLKDSITDPRLIGPRRGVIG